MAKHNLNYNIIREALGEYLNNNNVTYTELDGFWCDAGTPDSLAHATQLIINKRKEYL